jgi:bile acid:Na+ symporter, BASS family
VQKTSSEIPSQLKNKNMASHIFTHRPHDSYINVLLLSLFLGFVFPQFFAPLNIYSTFFLQVIFFISSLKIDFLEIGQELRHWKTLLLVNFFMLFLLPVIAYTLGGLFFPELILPLLLLASMPAGMTSPLLTELIRGNVPLALLITITTSLLAPFTIPFILQFLSGGSVSIDTTAMILTLIQVIFVPFILAQLLRLFISKPALTKAGRPLKNTSFLFLGTLLTSIVAKHSSSLHDIFSFEALGGIFQMFLFFILVHFLAFTLFFWRNNRDRLTITLCIVYMNFTLAVFIAQKFFPDPRIIFFTIISLIPWNICIIVFRSVSERLLKKAPQTSSS